MSGTTFIKVSIFSRGHSKRCVSYKDLDFHFGFPHLIHFYFGPFFPIGLSISVQFITVKPYVSIFSTVMTSSIKILVMYMMWLHMSSTMLEHVVPFVHTIVVKTYSYNFFLSFYLLLGFLLAI